MHTNPHISHHIHENIQHLSVETGNTGERCTSIGFLWCLAHPAMDCEEILFELSALIVITTYMRCTCMYVLWMCYYGNVAMEMCA